MRAKMFEAILKRYSQFGPADQKEAVVGMLKRIGDMDLIVFAEEIGVDTAKVLASEEVAS